MQPLLSCLLPRGGSGEAATSNATFGGVRLLAYPCFQCFSKMQVDSVDELTALMSCKVATRDVPKPNMAKKKVTWSKRGTARHRT